MPGPRRSAKKARERKVDQKALKLEKSLERVERRGGYRPNAGMKPGTRTVAKRLLAVREITEDIIKSGKVPLRVMINNMLYYDEKAVYLDEQLADALADNAKKFDPDKFLQALELVSKIGDARMKATQIASMAAPYIHPRLSAITMDVHKHDHPRDLPRDATIEAHRDDFRRLRSVPMVSQPDTEVVAEPTDEET